MKAVLLRTGSAPVHFSIAFGLSKGFPFDEDPGAGISFPGKNSMLSPRPVHLEMRSKKQTPKNNLRRTVSDSDLIPLSEVANTTRRVRTSNRASARSTPATITEEGYLEAEEEDDDDEKEEGSKILKWSSFDFGVAEIYGENKMLVEELEFSGGGMGRGRKSGGGNGGGRGKDESGDGTADQNNIGAYYEQMLKANPANPLLLRNYGKYLHEVEKDYERAEEYYGRALLASPGDGDVLSLYGKLIWETQRDQSRAAGYYDQAVKACPDDCYVLGSYAHFLWDADDDDEEEEEEDAVGAKSPPLVKAR